MPNLNATGEIWQYAEMKKLGEEHQKKMRLFQQNDKVSPPKAQLGCKDTPWWPFIPVERFIVPLHIARAKEHIKTFKSDRKIDDEGIETALFSVFKDLYGVKLQAYHGGSLHGKDHQKIMSNADEIFTLFAEILKENAKEDCKLTHDEIEELCQKYSNLYILWDGAFSYASTINPSREDIAMYERFVTAAVHSHKELGMNVTPKVHLMWMHVKRQMEFPGGFEEAGHYRIGRSP